MIDTISGAVSLYIYHYRDKKYYLFGDRHGTRQNSCYKKGLSCDAFNYNFTSTTNANTNCTTLGALFHNWFNYNNHHHIKTDFYIEEYYTKEDEREEAQEYIDILSKRTTINTHEGEPFKDKSWMEILPYVMSACFVKNKSNCPYNPYVHLHYVDVRTILTPQGLINITPFSIYHLLEYMDEHQPTTIEALDLLRQETLGVIDFIVKNYRTLLGYLLFDGLEKYKTLLLTTNSAFVLPLIDNVQYFTKNGMLKVAHELQRLSLDPFIYDQLILYIDDMVDKNLNDIYKYEESIKENIRKYNLLKKRNLLKTRGLRRGYQDLQTIVKGYDLLFIHLDAILMDVYTLSRMFIQDGEEVIVYAGAYHINLYHQFFNRLTTPLLSIPYDKNTSCLTDPSIPLYIHVDRFKMMD